MNPYSSGGSGGGSSIAESILSGVGSLLTYAAKNIDWGSVADSVIDNISDKKTNKGDANAYHKQGCALNEAGRYEEAVEAFNMTIELNPSEVSAYCNKGFALSKLGYYKEALDAYNMAIEIEPSLTSAIENVKKDILKKIK